MSYPSVICQLPVSYPAVIHELYANALQSLLMFILRSPWILVMTSTHGNNSSYTSVIHELCPLGSGGKRFPAFFSSMPNWNWTSTICIFLYRNTIESIYPEAARLRNDTIHNDESCQKAITELDKIQAEDNANANNQQQGTHSYIFVMYFNLTV